MLFPNQMLVPMNKGPKMKNIPQGMSVTQAVKRGMTEHPNQSELGAAVAGMNTKGYRFVKSLLLLLEQDGLSLVNKEKIIDTLAKIDRERTVGSAYRSVGHLVGIKQRESSTKVHQRRRRFEKTVMNIGVTCESMSELNIPKELSRRDIKEAIVSLSTSIQQISKLISRLAGEAKEQS